MHILLGTEPLNLINQKFNDRIKILNFFFKIPFVHQFLSIRFFEQGKILRQGQNIIGSKITFIKLNLKILNI